jgi:hypothetical protein
MVYDASRPGVMGRSTDNHRPGPPTHTDIGMYPEAVSPEDGAEGWYKDPYGEHEARWFSAGTPTSLVRDGRVESRDEPPERPIDGQLERIDGAASAGDLRRADDEEAPPPDSYRAGADAINEAWLGPAYGPLEGPTNRR